MKTTAGLVLVIVMTSINCASDGPPGRAAAAAQKPKRPLTVIPQISAILLEMYIHQ